MGHKTNPTLGRYVIPDMPSADELLPYLRQIDSNRWYSNYGPLVLAFEDRLTQHLTARTPTAAQAPIVLTTLMTCYHALQIGLQVLHLPPSAHVLVPAVTFPACPLAIQHAGAIPVFADVDAETWQLTPQTARAVAKKMPIHAVMPVAVYGVSVDVRAWDAFMDDTGIPVIIDAAAAFETQAIPEKCLLAHSFHATKPFSIGEGGALIARRRDWIDEARCMANFGTVNRLSMHDGSNAKLSEYLAAVGLAQLDRWETVKQRRRTVFQLYQTALRDSGCDIDLQLGIDKIVVSALMLRLSRHMAHDVVVALNAQNIAAHRMYLPPLYRHPHFTKIAVVNSAGQKADGIESLDRKAALMPVSEMLDQSVIGLPCHAFLSAADVNDAVNGLAEILKGEAYTAKACC